MTKKISFTKEAFEEYLSWQKEDKRIIKRINQLIEDIIRNGNVGIGKPELLKNNYDGFWSRRIDEKHRLVYRFEGEFVIIVSCRTHYGDK